MECEELKNSLLEIADYFYKGEYKAGNEALNSVLPVVAQYVEQLMEDKKEEILNKAFVPLLHAMEKQDGIYIADIIYFEMLERI